MAAEHGVRAFVVRQGSNNNAGREERIVAISSSSSGLDSNFKMRGEDAGETVGTANRYVTWISVGDPDFNGNGYSGGTHTDGSSPTGAFVAGSAVVLDEFN